jgi:pantoate--beta-alanine ligase
MLVLHSPQVIQEMTMRWKRDSKIAFVPTMGALHEGHLRLVEAAKRFGQKTIVSIFVNPLQFGAGEDFDAYPRTLEADAEKLQALDVDLLVAPSIKDFYPEGFSSRVRIDKLGDHLCGASRPGHFEGVTTVCLKLFQITQADFAIFGEKDFQQMRILSQMAQDLNLPLTVVPEPIVREADGLAMSSRNRYLSPEQRAHAARIPIAWRRAQAVAAARSDATVSDVLNAAVNELEAAPLVIDYLAVAPERTLVPCSRETRLSDISLPRLFIAVKNGSTRLIDNAPLREIP